MHGTGYLDKSGNIYMLNNNEGKEVRNIITPKLMKISRVRNLIVSGSIFIKMSKSSYA